MQFENGMTVVQLKQLLANWPETDEHGEPCEVWLGDGNGLSNQAKESRPLNMREREETGRKSADLLLLPAPIFVNDFGYRSYVQLWQPIESAPKDGTEVLVFCPNDWRILCGRYCSVYEGLRESAWVDTVEQCHDIKPTHWMPLPEAPNAP